MFNDDYRYHLSCCGQPPLHLRIAIKLLLSLNGIDQPNKIIEV
jgi:hypothetical protein